MAKPRKKRNVLYPPWMYYFKPHGHRPFEPGSEVILTIDEYESIRLADHENLKQEEAAKKMNISRPTFTRLVDGARKKIADAMVNGKVIKIEGGSFVFLRNRLRCMSCGNIWDTGEKIVGEQPCPECRSQNIVDIGRRLGRGMTRRRGGPGRNTGR
ncbi:MAG: DUF134 domain-containing protein [Actinomycetia bacterium]|nr:DUF134 domain-containing protein [Actinomycetes bacterium]